MPVAEALARVLAHTEPLAAVATPLADAHGRVLAADLAALRTQPPADVSAMDGYAVHSQDVASGPVRLKLVGEVAAGHPFQGAVGRGEAARIFTGGVLPPGTDTIVIQENTVREGDAVLVNEAPAKGKHVRIEGLDFKRGAVLLAKGRRLRDRDLALAAAMNYPTVPVHRSPKVALLATGDELVMPGGTPGFGQIVYSNGYATMALARREGCEVADLGIVPDRLAETAAGVRRAREVGTHVLGLPGNPVSAYVCAVLFLLPLIRQLAGRSDVAPAPDTARLGRDLPANDERADYLRAVLTAGSDGIAVATPAPVQDSSMLM